MTTCPNCDSTDLVLIRRAPDGAELYQCDDCDWSFWYVPEVQPEA